LTIQVIFGQETRRSLLINAISNSIDSTFSSYHNFDSNNEAWAYLQVTIAQAQAVLNNPDSTVAQLEAAYTALSNAIGALQSSDSGFLASLISALPIAGPAVLLVSFLFVLRLLLRKKKAKIRPLTQTNNS